MNDTPTYRPFIKAHGLKNDFVIFDSREDSLALTAQTIRQVADRRSGVGCDQLIVLGHSVSADCFMEIHNADGGEVAACGNATRCVGDLLMQESKRDRVTIETRAGILTAERVAAGVRVNMGEPRLAWQDIPLSTAMDTASIELSVGPLNNPVGVNMGNPHAVFFVSEAESVDLARLGPEIENHALFPQRVNASVATVRPDGSIRLRVWERGAGITPACGTAACAALVAAHRRALTGRTATVDLDGGPLLIEWTEIGHILMTGAATTAFEGRIAL